MAIFRSIVIAYLLLSCSAAAGEGIPQAGYEVQASDITIPEGVKLGKYRRITQPFENWILICDENMQDMRKVCNISQSIVNSHKTMVFSWSMAATKDGKPYMILRVPAGAESAPLALQLQGRAKPVDVAFTGCDDSVCVALLPVGPILRQHIDQGTTAQITYSIASGEKVTVSAPLRGLRTALLAIK